MAKRIGIFGGTFNPVHIGHLIVAQDAMEYLELSEVVFMPSSIAPHKQHLMPVDPRHRLNMLNLCLETDIRFSASDMEVQRGGVSYTYDTVCDFMDGNPGVQVILLVGSDTLLDMHNWFKVDDILNMCEVATFMRPGAGDPERFMDQVRLPEQYRENLLKNIFAAHLVDVSSSDIRMRVAEGLGIRYLVPAEVEMYIYEHGLYRG